MLSSRQLRGFICLAGVVVLWVGSAVAIQLLFDEFGYDEPFIITWLPSSMFMGYLLVYMSSKARERTFRNQKITKESTLLVTKATSGHHFRRIFVNAAIFTPLWFLANFPYNLSLKLAQGVASVTIISSTSSFFTLFFTSFFLKRTTHRVSVRLRDVVCCVVCFVGVVLITLQDAHGTAGVFDRRKMMSDALALLGAVGYGSYTVFIRARVDEQRDMPLFFGLTGALTLALGLPFILWRDSTAMPTGMTLTVLLGNAFVGSFVADYLMAKAVLLLSPLYATLGVSLTIPVALIYDVFSGKKTFSLGYLLGSALVFGGFATASPSL